MYCVWGERSIKLARAPKKEERDGGVRTHIPNVAATCARSPDILGNDNLFDIVGINFSVITVTFYAFTIF